MNNHMQDEKRSFVKKPIFIGLIFIGAITILALVIIGFFVYQVTRNPEYYSLEELIDLSEGSQGTEAESPYDHPLLTTEQEKLLQSAGIDISTLPRELTDDQINCGIEALGQNRVEELISGESPSLTDILKAQHCF